jgi:hypothetical protein
MKAESAAELASATEANAAALELLEKEHARVVAEVREGVWCYSDIQRQTDKHTHSKILISNYTHATHTYYTYITMNLIVQQHDQ